MELSRAGRTENKGKLGRAQANAEGPGLNNLAVNELQAVWTGKQMLCQDLQNAEDFCSELVSKNAR